MNKKLSIKVQKISSHLPLSASAFSNAVVINPEDTTALLKKGSLYAIFDVKANSEFDVLLTTKIINDILHDSYFMSEMTSPIQALEKAVLDVKEKIVNLATHSFGNTDFNIIVAVLWGNVVYIVQYGKAKSYLVRDGTISPINSSSEGYFSVSSGVVKDSDAIILGNQSFMDSITPERMLSDSTVLQDLPITNSALVLKFVVDSVLTLEDTISFNEKSVGHKAKINFLYSIFSKITKRDRLKSIKLKTPKITKLPKKSHMLIFFIAGLLVISVYFTVKRNSEKSSTDKKDVLGSEKSVNLEQQKILDQKILDEQYKIVRVSPLVFYDIRITDSSASPNNLAVVDGYLAVSDYKAGALYTSLLSAPKFVKDSKIYKNIGTLSNIGGKLGFNDADGYIIYDLAADKAVKNYTFSRELTGITAGYLDFIYEVDKGKVTKFVKNGDKLEGSLWAQSDDFNNVIGMAVNVSIFIAKNDGTVLSYTRGVKDNFSVIDLDKPMSKITGITADINNDRLYIADAGNKRVVVIDNKGNLIKQILNVNQDVWDDIKSIGINSDATRLYVLNGSKIYEVSL